MLNVRSVAQNSIEHYWRLAHPSARATQSDFALSRSGVGAPHGDSRPRWFLPQRWPRDLKPCTKTSAQPLPSVTTFGKHPPLRSRSHLRGEKRNTPPYIDATATLLVTFVRDFLSARLDAYWSGICILPAGIRDLPSFIDISLPHAISPCTLRG